MTKEKVFDIFKDVLSKAGWEDVVSLSESTNELADIMIYQRENDDEYLAANGRPLFPFPAIKNILYQYGPENFYNYVGTEVQFVIELQGNSEYIFEFGENDNIELMNFNGEWITEYKLIVDALAQYNHQIAYRINMECLVKSVLEIIEGHDTIDELDLKEIQGVVNQYIERNPADLDFLFHYAYISLEIFVFKDEDLFDIKNIIKKIVHEKCEDNFIDYIRKQNIEYGVNSYYLSLATEALRLIRENKKIQKIRDHEEKSVNKILP